MGQEADRISKQMETVKEEVKDLRKARNAVAHEQDDVHTLEASASHPHHPLPALLLCTASQCHMIHEGGGTFIQLDCDNMLPVFCQVDHRNANNNLQLEKDLK